LDLEKVDLKVAEKVEYLAVLREILMASKTVVNWVMLLAN